MNWAFAGTVSVALHVVVLMLFFWSGREVGSPEPNGPETAVSETPRQSPPVEKAVEKAETREPEMAQVAVETYVVRKGDMLTHIAQDRNCTIQDLAKLNGTTAKRLANLRVGQKIKVPRKAD